jgi:quercetin dioxygenase-like cupin family protein
LGYYRVSEEVKIISDGQKRWEMFEKHSEVGYMRAVDGVEQKTLVYGEKTLMTEFRLHKGAVLPLHAHPHEQSGYLVSGRIRLTIGAEVHLVSPGDSWCIAGGIKHGAEIIDDSVAVEVFAPLRKEYLPEPRRSESV